MAKKDQNQNRAGSEPKISSTPDELLTAALERGDDSLETGRYIVTFKENASDEAIKSLATQGVRFADARDYADQAVTFDNVGDAEALVFPEIGSAVISGAAYEARGLGALADGSTESPIETIEPDTSCSPRTTRPAICGASVARPRRLPRISAPLASRTSSPTRIRWSWAPRGG